MPPSQGPSSPQVLKCCLLLLVLIPGMVQAQTIKLPRLEPSGISGSLLLCGGQVSDFTIQKFLENAGGQNARLVILQAGNVNEQSSELVKKIFSLWVSKKTASLSLVRLDLGENQEQEKLAHSALQSATGVWLIGSKETTKNVLWTGKPMKNAFQSILQRKGIIAASGPSALLFADNYAIPPSDEHQVGLGLFPDSILVLNGEQDDNGTNLNGSLEKYPGFVGYQIQPTSALLIQGRKLISMGEGAVTIHLPKSKNWPRSSFEMKGRQRALDLTTLRRSARTRVGSEFPPKKVASPRVDKGTLIIVGGGGMPNGLFKRFVELSGGKKGHIVLLPTAVPDPVPSQKRLVDLLTTLGAGKVTVLPGRKITEVESPEYLDAFRSATGIWFGGGRQWHFVDAYKDTKAHELMHQVLQRGGVIGGSSAGASIQGEYMARGSFYNNFAIMAEGYEQGLGFLKGVAIDQHFSQRKRFKDMSSLVQKYPQLLGIGLDEATAIIVQGPIAEVVGKGKVHFYDAKRKHKGGEADYQALSEGGKYNLQTRKILAPHKSARANPAFTWDFSEPVDWVDSKKFAPTEDFLASYRWARLHQQ